MYMSTYMYIYIVLCRISQFSCDLAVFGASVFWTYRISQERIFIQTQTTIELKGFGEVRAPKIDLEHHKKIGRINHKYRLLQ